MDDEHTSLTGAWMGRYTYEIELPIPPVPFEATLIEIAGAISGEVTEPNTFQRGAGAQLVATVAGTRDGFDVSFRKTYEGFDQPDYPAYEGTSNANLTRIDGTWSFPKDPTLRGRFMMVRAVTTRAATGQKREEPITV